MLALWTPEPHWHWARSSAVSASSTSSRYDGSRRWRASRTPYLSQIERGLRAPSERVVDAIARSLAMSTSALYEQAGIRPLQPEGDPGARAAIEADARLTSRQRRALLEVYDNFVALNQRGP